MTPDVGLSPLQQGIDCARLCEGLTDERVRDAMQSVMRHVFVREEVQMSAYLDVESPIGHGRRCPRPSVAARLVEAAEPAHGAALCGGRGLQGSVAPRAVLKGLKGLKGRDHREGASSYASKFKLQPFAQAPSF